MGQGASGIQDAGLPRGYQPGEAAPRLTRYDDDGTWKPQPGGGNRLNPAIELHLSHQSIPSSAGTFPSGQPGSSSRLDPAAEFHLSRQPVPPPAGRAPSFQAGAGSTVEPPYGDAWRGIPDVDFDAVSSRSSHADMALHRRASWEAPLSAHADTGAAERRASWDIGSIVEVYSATVNCWYPARVMEVLPGADGHEVLTVQFFVDECPKQKSMYRGDAQLVPLGTYTAGQLPPGFQEKPSQSKPGQTVYLDATTGVKYATGELAWRVHFERLLQGPPVGLETVCAVPGRPVPPPPASPRPISLAELQGHQPVSPGAAGPFASSPTHASPTAREPLEPHGPFSSSPTHLAAGEPMEPHDSGKITLPRFGDAMGSQAAYLGYVGTPGAAGAAAPVHRAAPVQSRPAGYPASGSTQQRRPPWAGNPVLQNWQEDPFSEWRR